MGGRSGGTAATAPDSGRLSGGGAGAGGGGAAAAAVTVTVELFKISCLDDEMS